MNTETPSSYARRAVEASYKANHAAILAGEEFLSREKEAVLIDLYCPVTKALALLSRQRVIDKFPPDERERAQQEIDREISELMASLAHD
jgi:hypothetical protein